MADKGGNTRRPVVIRREEVVEGGHHGGAWKVAYADFVTAMMAFFLLMWLLNATTEAQRKGLADYFSPANVLGRNLSGSGRPFGGKTPFSDGEMVSDAGAMAVMVGRSQAPSSDGEEDGDRPLADARTHPDDTEQAARPTGPEGGAGTPTQGGGGGLAATAALAPVQTAYLAHAASGSAPRPVAGPTDPALLAERALRQELARRETEGFVQAAQTIRDTVAADPALADMARQLRIDMTPEGLRIQLLDADRQAMFATGSAELDERARGLLRKVADVLRPMPQAISITGHTDAAPFRGGDRSNWELSSERANATRRLLVDSGVPESRFATISGRADRDPLLPAEPMAAANRRIAVVVLRAGKS